MKVTLSLLATAALLAGCAAVDPAPVAPPRFAAVQPTEVPVARAPTGSIYNGVQSENWFGRGRNFQVGDVITVLLDERTQGSRSTSTNVSREAKNNIVPRAWPVVRFSDLLGWRG